MRFQINPFTDKLDISGMGPGATSVDFVTGNSGGQVAADAGFNVFLLGDNTSGINSIGNLSPNTLTFFGLASSTTQIGTSRFATNAEAAAQTLGTIGITPANITSLFSTNPLPSSQGGTGLSSPAAHSLIVTEGSSAFTVLGVAANGQLPIGSIGSDPVLANITSTGGTITITNGPGTINIEANGTAIMETLTGNSGGVIHPTAGNINTLGTGSITIAGAGSTLTTQLTGLTNHAVLVGAGTATITNIAATANTGAVLQNNSGADPSYSTATYPSTTTINQILFSSAANTVTGLATANQAVLTTGATGVPVLTALATNGQLIIGSTAGVPAAATLTAGTGISITNGSNSITIASTVSLLAWSDNSGTFTAVTKNGYFITATSIATMPASPSEGDTIAFIVDSTQFLTITGNTGQKLRIGSAISAAAGTAVNNVRGDTVEFVYRSTGTTWFATSVNGTWTVT